ncbi:MAG: chromosomal replication initiator DnaA [Paracoccaceae bacterium]
MAQQLAFDLPSRAALSREDFFVSQGNAQAVAAIEGWAGWPDGKLVLSGAHGAGKTHLVHVWAQLAGARIVAARDLASLDPARLVADSGRVAVEDIDAVVGARGAEVALFHLHNLIVASGGALLMSCVQPPGRLGFALPDLQSRLQGGALAVLAPPDDALLAAVLVKLFADRQIVVSPGVIGYLVSRMGRSFAAAQTLVAALDAAALSERRAVTKALAAPVLDKLSEPRA